MITYKLYNVNTTLISCRAHQYDLSCPHAQIGIGGALLEMCFAEMSL